MNITLIGMAGVGKSTIGKRLARRLNYDFIDVDVLIREKMGSTLQDMIDEGGDQVLLDIEEEMLLSLDIGDNCIISPGGSAVYSRKGMEFLKKNSRIIFLDAPFWLISRRIRDPADRGMVGLEGKTLKQLFNERLVLYKRYSDAKIRIKGKDKPARVVDKVIRKCFGEEFLESLKNSQ